MAKTGTAGNREKKLRSDCFVTFELTGSDGIRIDVKSKVSKVYGEDIAALCRGVLSFFEIENARIHIEDEGALPFVIAARVEAALKKCIVTDAEYLPDLIPENSYPTERDRLRRSRLYIPGNIPRMMINAGIYQPDAVILDLEDAVTPEKKSEARVLVRNALRQVNFYGAERMVRINQIPTALEDLEYVIPHNVHVILLPKCENAEQVLQVDQKIRQICEKKAVTHPVYLMPIVESAMGIIKAFEIATASPHVVALGIGLEDYTADLGVHRTNGGRESLFGRSMIVNAARAAGIQPIDSVFSNFTDMDALKAVVLESKALGFDGMGCIHPRQVPIIHEHYAPTEEEIAKAKRVVKAFNDAHEKGLGVVALGSKMIDLPVLKRAMRTMEVAAKSTRCPEDWREKDAG